MGFSHGRNSGIVFSGGSVQTGKARSRIGGNPKPHHQIIKESVAHCHNGENCLPKPTGEIFNAEAAENLERKGLAVNEYGKEFLEFIEGQSTPFEKYGHSG